MTMNDRRFDIDEYVADFASVVDAYGLGTDDALEADRGVARSIIPPGTAGVRDFSRLAPRIPELMRIAALDAWPA